MDLVAMNYSAASAKNKTTGRPCDWENGLPANLVGCPVVTDCHGAIALAGLPVTSVSGPTSQVPLWHLIAVSRIRCSLLSPGFKTAGAIVPICQPGLQQPCERRRV